MEKFPSCSWVQNDYLKFILSHTAYNDPKSTAKENNGQIKCPVVIEDTSLWKFSDISPDLKIIFAVFILCVCLAFGLQIQGG